MFGLQKDLPSWMKLLGRPAVWDIASIVRKEKIDDLSVLPGFSLRPACEDLHQEKEWGLFLDFLRKYERTATSNSDLIEDRISPEQRYPEVNGGYSCDLKAKGSSRQGNSAGPSKFIERNFVIAHPSYLKTLGQSHSSWIFGAIAELVDNSRDAKATKLEVAISMIYSKTAGKDIPMLSLIDDGHGMSHEDVQRMISFGHAQPEADEPDRIGRYGIGFKTGVMRLGKDALVLTQTANSRSIAFLSQSLNEGKDNLEIPIVSYSRIGQYMEVDTNVQNEESAKYNLKIIKKFSPFDKYLIGEKAGLFKGNGSGTQIFIWNLDEWGSSYSLQWEAGMTGGSSFHQGGIFIRSRRIRSRPGQISRTSTLAKSLSKTIVQNGSVLGKPVQLTLGRSQLEWEQANCGIFLYWRGRLIEEDAHGHVWVHNNKQSFQDCEAYAELEKWLGEKADEYLDKYVDKIPLSVTGPENNCLFAMDQGLTIYA
ncbi:hypothetical protein DH2020_035705 [Rehmannia glutinosa]|uniref:MORC family CW-type zinc finger protein n=1 Tax=Rehmannia glutinosa TaxID=99300 RepID=A0ABR0V8Y8_REHGL